MGLLKSVVADARRKRVTAPRSTLTRNTDMALQAPPATDPVSNNIRITAPTDRDKQSRTKRTNSPSRQQRTADSISRRSVTHSPEDNASVRKNKPHNVLLEKHSAQEGRGSEGNVAAKTTISAKTALQQNDYLHVTKTPDVDVESSKVSTPQDAVKTESTRPEMTENHQTVQSPQSAPSMDVAKEPENRPRNKSSLTKNVAPIETQTTQHRGHPDTTITNKNSPDNASLNDLQATNVNWSITKSEKPKSENRRVDSAISLESGDDMQASNIAPSDAPREVLTTIEAQPLTQPPIQPLTPPVTQPPAPSVPGVSTESADELQKRSSPTPEPEPEQAQLLRAESVLQEVPMHRVTPTLIEVPSRPEVRIGQVDVIVESPAPAKAPRASNTRPSVAMASRLYLRRL